VPSSSRGKGVEVTSGGPADQQWEQFVSDAAAALPALDELHETVPAFVEAPFDIEAQRRLREFLESDGLSRATAAAHRIVTGPAPLAEGA
jgi:hypothetical protein